MGKFVCKCSCGKYYSHDELENAVCPECGSIGKNMETQKHQCHLCVNANNCSEERQELTKKAGICFYYKN